MVQADAQDHVGLLEERIKSASKSKLDEMLDHCINLYDESVEEYSELDKSLFKYVLDNVERDESGRIVVPALWDKQAEHLLSDNFNLAHKILWSTYKKLKNRPEALSQYDDVIQDQLREGIVEKIPDLREFLEENPNASFLPHSAVIRESSSTTKCRVVFLSNLCERAGGKKSHNEISFPGANLNQSLFTSLLLLRFDKYLLSFDLRKAFLMIKIRPEDSLKLLFLWFKDVQSGDFEVVGLRFLRLGFGLRFSPSILVSVLYYILFVNIDKSDPELCAIAKRFYSLLYMDNISFTSSKIEDITSAYGKSFEIFNPYQFDLQKFLTNVPCIQSLEDEKSGEITDSTVDLFGIMWDRTNDQILCRGLNLNSDANTQRKILQSLNSQYDPIGIYLPLLNRAKFFLHALQIDKSLGWDDHIGPDRCKEWNRICKQVNSHEQFSFNRMIGERSGIFKLVGFSDASEDALGLTFYLWDVETNECSFIMAKGKVLGRELKSKSIPVLELIASAWGAEIAVQLFHSLITAVEPINVSNIIMFSDSMISLSWVRSRLHKTGKIERKSVIVNNKVNKIVSL